MTDETFTEVDFNFKLIKKLGEGAFSTVYKLEMVDKNQFIALKRYKKTCKPSVVLQEIKILKRLSKDPHPLLPKLIKGFRVIDQVSLVLTLCDSESFESYFDKLPVESIKFYMKSLLGALSHIHKHGIIHRDVKPSNFLFDPSTNNCMLIDFGLSETTEDRERIQVLPKGKGKRKRSYSLISKIPLDLVERRNRPSSKSERVYLRPSTNILTILQATGTLELLSQKGPRAGTRGYKAPEVLLRVSKNTTAIDVWSSGVILLSLLSGYLYPFHFLFRIHIDISSTGRTPFFESCADLRSLAQIMIICGTQEVVSAAKVLGKNVFYTYQSLKCDLVKLCKDLRHARKIKEIECKELYEVLEMCLDPNPSKRITSQEALNKLT
eukprot:TRINITY_DN2089_c0_g1_i2.p1 TRINITY_DN2089_c0_g1~~TRINITY_DN2089_c0_g1_i2.p1  ORF type:complete len:380 (+),score=6.83 TRINITY_DN2089_c0_g1_i2:10-1149(+)